MQHRCSNDHVVGVIGKVRRSEVRLNRLNLSIVDLANADRGPLQHWQAKIQQGNIEVVTGSFAQSQRVVPRPASDIEHAADVLSRRNGRLRDQRHRQRCVYRRGLARIQRREPFDVSVEANSYIVDC